MIKIDVWKNVLRILDTYLEMNNHRKTPERYTILKAIYNIHGHFTLEDLSDKLIRDYNFPVSRATLYNTLNLFMQLRLVIRHRFQGSTVYEACYDNTSHCHQICTVCGKVTEVKSRRHPSETVPQGWLYTLHLRHLQHLSGQTDASAEQGIEEKTNNK